MVTNTAHSRSVAHPSVGIHQPRSPWLLRIDDVFRTQAPTRDFTDRATFAALTGALPSPVRPVEPNEVAATYAYLASKRGAPVTGEP
ncbi:MAG: hypothetical protein JWL58_6965 [Streptosporangiaceae bacterium]|jgi:hypothetical protein|nr:hypothetical protein [Streptosporangiaceae bacterium]